MLSTRAHRVVRQCDFAGRISPDSRLGVRNDHIFGAHAPDAHEVELADLGGLDLGAKLLEAMGADLGAIHAAHRRREQVLVDVQRRDPRWLEQATKAAEEYVRRDFAVSSRCRKQSPKHAAQSETCRQFGSRALPTTPLR